MVEESPPSSTELDLQHLIDRPGTSTKQYQRDVGGENDEVELPPAVSGESLVHLAALEIDGAEHDDPEAGCREWGEESRQERYTPERLDDRQEPEQAQERRRQLFRRLHLPHRLLLHAVHDEGDADGDAQRQQSPIRSHQILQQL